MIDITFRICWPLRLISWSKIKNVISVAYLQIGLDFTSKTSTVLYIVVSAISANKTCYMMMFLPLRGPPSFGWADHSNHHLFHCSHICTMTLNAQLLLCIPTCPCPASQQLGGQSLTTLTKFCPLMTTYLHLWLEITLQVQGKTWIPMKFPVPPTYLPHLVNVVKERPPSPSVHQHKSKLSLNKGNLWSVFAHPFG